MKQISLFLVLLFIMSCSSTTQSTQEIVASDYFEVVDEPPEIIGGLQEVSKHLQYPKAAVEEGIEGTVVVKAYVGTTGDVDEVAVAASPHDLLSKAALDAVRMIRFSPGMIDGEAVKVVVQVPVKFNLK